MMKIDSISSETIYQARVFSLCRESVILPNGVEASLDIIHHPGAAAIVPLLPGNQVVMIRQYRHAIRQFLWEIPAGTLNPGEDPIECARRELVEEAGYRANHFEKLIEVFTAPGYSDEKIHIFLATDLEPAIQDLDQEEIIEVAQMPLERTLDMIGEGAIQNGMTIVGLSLLWKRSLGASPACRRNHPVASSKR